jgi:hypothetical protein
MKLETKFIKNLEGYLFQEFSDFDKKRIRSFLEEYKLELNLTEKVVIKEVVREVKIYEKVETLPTEFPLQKYRIAATQTVLLEEAKLFCEKHGITIDVFMMKKRKTDHAIAVLRKEFCAMIMDRFMVKLKTLSTFFQLHYSTLHFYLYGSKYTPKTNRPSNLQNPRKYKIKKLCTD